MLSFWGDVISDNVHITLIAIKTGIKRHDSFGKMLTTQNYQQETHKAGSNVLAPAGQPINF